MHIYIGNVLCPFICSIPRPIQYYAVKKWYFRAIGSQWDPRQEAKFSHFCESLKLQKKSTRTPSK